MKITPINGSTETEGSKFNYRGIDLMVARSGNANFKTKFREALKPYKEEFDSGRISEEKSNEIMIECVAKTILVGWDKLVDANGEEYEYSVENAISLLTDDDDCYDAVMKFADNIDNYLTESNEALKVK